MCIRITSTILRNYEADILRKDLMAFLYFRSVRFQIDYRKYILIENKHISLLTNAQRWRYIQLTTFSLRLGR